jgi:hypothetical protein
MEVNITIMSLLACVAFRKETTCTLKLKPLAFSETLVTIYKATVRHIPKDEHCIIFRDTTPYKTRDEV